MSWIEIGVGDDDIVRGPFVRDDDDIADLS